MSFGLTLSYRQRRPINGRQSTLAQWQLIASAVVWGFMVVACYINVVQYAN